MPGGAHRAAGLRRQSLVLPPPAPSLGVRCTTPGRAMPVVPAVPPALVRAPAVMTPHDGVGGERRARVCDAKARRSDHAKAKDATRLSEDGLPLHSFRTLLDDLATLAYNVCHTPLNPQAKIVMITRPTPVQEKAFRLLNVNPAICTQ